MPYKIDRIMEPAYRYEISVIDDEIEGVGSRYASHVLATFGKYSMVWFNDHKIITISCGGAFICENEADKKEMLLYATPTQC